MGGRPLWTPSLDITPYPTPYPTLPYYLTLLPAVCVCVQTRVDEVNINARLAMERLFGTPDWEQQLQQLR